MTADDQDLRAQVDALPMGAVLRALHAQVSAWQEDPGDAWRARYLLRGLRAGDPGLVRMAFAPYDDEPVTDEERAALAEAAEDVRAGRVLPWPEVRDRWLRP